MTTRVEHLTPTCSWASCPRTYPPHKVGQWDFCTEHLAEHLALFEPNRPGRPAMVDDTKTPRELLDWLHPKKYKQAMSQRVWAMAQPPKPRPKMPPRVYGPRALMPCGTHAAYARHKTRGEAVCGPCGVEEKRYQRDRKRVERAA